MKEIELRVTVSPTLGMRVERQGESLSWTDMTRDEQLAVVNALGKLYLEKVKTLTPYERDGDYFDD